MIEKWRIIFDSEFWTLIDELSNKHSCLEGDEDDKPGKLSELVLFGYKLALNDVISKYDEHSSHLMDPELCIESEDLLVLLKNWGFNEDELKEAEELFNKSSRRQYPEYYENVVE